MRDDRAKRFYGKAAVSGDGRGVLLDARALKTPARRVFRAPTRALASAIAAEWQAQGARIIPAALPLTQLAFAAIDADGNARAERIAYVAKFGETDLCCHRAERPAELAARQAAAWDPLVQWGALALGVRLPVVNGIIATALPAATSETLCAIAGALDDFRLTALAQAAALTGSALIALALAREEIEPGAAFEAAALDDLWSLEHWGEDSEARARLERLRFEIGALARFVAALDEV